MDDESTLDQDAEAQEPTDETAEPEGDKRYQKLQREAQSLRRQVRKFEAAEKYGPEVAKVIPDELPISKWDEFAETIRSTFQVAAQPTTEQSNEAVAASGEPTAEEHRLAAVTKQGQGASPTPGIFTAEDAIRLYTENPGQYASMRTAGLIKLDKLPGSDKE